MGKHRIRTLGTTALVTLAVGTTQALAGGLAIREQSAWGEGSSYAGVAAGGSVSSMFWNPATTTQTGKFALENSASMIFPQTTQTGTNNFAWAASFRAINDGIPNSAEPAFAAAAYTAMRLNDRLWLGFSLNSPFGLSVGFQNPNWAGAFYGESSTLKTYNASPSVAYKVTEWLSVGVGFQAQYAQANLEASAVGLPLAFLSAATVNLAQLTGDGWGFGYTAGVTVTPTAWTQIGLGYRSAIDQSINGSFTTNGFGRTPAPIATTVKLPELREPGHPPGPHPLADAARHGRVDQLAANRHLVRHAGERGPPLRRRAIRSRFHSSGRTAGSTRSGRVRGRTDLDIPRRRWL